MQKKLISATLILFIFSLKGLTCSCTNILDFVSNYRSTQTQVDLIKVVKVGEVAHGAIFKILDKAGNLSLEDTVTIWGDNGYLCRIGYTSQIAMFDTLLYILTPTDMLGNTIYGNEPELNEQSEDFMFGNCEVNYLQYKNDSVFSYHDSSKYSISSFYKMLSEEPSPVESKDLFVPLISYSSYTGNLSLTNNNSFKVSVQVLAMDGQVISTNNVDRNSRIEFNSLSSGIYLISVKGTRGQQACRKVYVK